MNTNIDLFEHYDELPLKIKEIINVFNTEIDLTENAYDLCKKLVSELEIHGYTCEFGLDAEPYNLQKLETTNETPEEMNTTEKNILIALFMGLSYCEKYTFEGWYKNHEHNERICDFDGLKYHSDWNDLIEVINKITTLEMFNYYEFNSLFWEVFCQLDIKETYTQVVLFIEWHSEPRKQKN